MPASDHFLMAFPSFTHRLALELLVGIKGFPSQLTTGTRFIGDNPFVWSLKVPSGINAIVSGLYPTPWDSRVLQIIQTREAFGSVYLAPTRQPYSRFHYGLSPSIPLFNKVTKGSWNCISSITPEICSGKQPDCDKFSLPQCSKGVSTTTLLANKYTKTR